VDAPRVLHSKRVGRGLSSQVNARSLGVLTTAVMAVACGIFSGIDDYEVVDGISSLDGSTAPNEGGSSGSTSGSIDGTGLHGAFRRELRLSSDGPGALDQHATLVVIPPTFDYAHTKPNGDDLRFSTTPEHSSDLPYFIESWAPGGTSFVWVLVPSVPLGVSTIQLFYGTEAQPASNFAATFPRAMKSVIVDGGTFSVPNDVTVDWFEVQAEHTLRLASAAPLTIRAQRILIAGTIDGNGRGQTGGPPKMTGSGPGGGGAGRSGGGGGYGGAGGRGGEAGAGQGGNPYGTATGTDIELGSGGGGASHPGANGGGAVTLIGWRTTVTGTIRVDGAEPSMENGENSGGGSGGGILIAGSFVELAGGTLSAAGGAGEGCLSTPLSGGGGGGGGRIKAFSRTNGSSIQPSTLSVAPGAGGPCPGGGVGIAGTIGTSHSATDSTFAKGVETTLGVEERL
jgi:hypothetical protein